MRESRLYRLSQRLPWCLRGLAYASLPILHCLEPSLLDQRWSLDGACLELYVIQALTDWLLGAISQVWRVVCHAGWLTDT